jgi:predicted nucleotidyltransferase
MPEVNIVKECEKILQGHYGPQFKGLVLYGSTAHQRTSSESDIDLLILLDKPFDHFRELRQIVDLLYPIQLKTDQLISAKPVAIEPSQLQ